MPSRRRPTVLPRPAFPLPPSDEPLDEIGGVAHIAWAGADLRQTTLRTIPSTGRRIILNASRDRVTSLIIGPLALEPLVVFLVLRNRGACACISKADESFFTIIQRNKFWGAGALHAFRPR